MADHDGVQIFTHPTLSNLTRNHSAHPWSDQSLTHVPVAPDHSPIYDGRQNGTYDLSAALEAAVTSLAAAANTSSDVESVHQGYQHRKWGMLGLSLLIVATAIGNVLVCLAVCWEKRLQNMTNYFLMSLAIADLFVSLMVMPLGLVVEIYGMSPFY